MILCIVHTCKSFALDFHMRCDAVDVLLLKNRQMKIKRHSHKCKPFENAIRTHKCSAVSECIAQQSDLQLWMKVFPLDKSVLFLTQSIFVVVIFFLLFLHFLILSFSAEFPSIHRFYCGDFVFLFKPYVSVAVVVGCVWFIHLAEVHNGAAARQRRRRVYFTLCLQLSFMFVCLFASAPRSYLRHFYFNCPEQRNYDVPLY